MKPKAIDKVLIKVTVRKARVDGMKQKFIRSLAYLNTFHMKWLGLFHLDGISRIDVAYDWIMFSLPSIIKQKAHKNALLLLLIGSAKWEAEKLFEVTQCRPEAHIFGGDKLSAW